MRDFTLRRAHSAGRALGRGHFLRSALWGEHFLGENNFGKSTYFQGEDDLWPKYVPIKFLAPISPTYYDNVRHLEKNK